MVEAVIERDNDVHVVTVDNMKNVEVNVQAINANGNESKFVNVFCPNLEKMFSVFRVPDEALDSFEVGCSVSLACELRLKRDGTPFFVYLK